MPNTLQAAISDLASVFAASVVAAIRGASLEDILAVADTRADAPARPGPGRPKGTKSVAKPAASTPTAPAKPPTRPIAKPATKPATKATTDASKGDRLKRRSPADIAKALTQVVDLLKKNPKGLRAEQIRAELKMESKEMPRILKEGLSRKALKSKGQKRSTTYSAA